MIVEDGAPRHLPYTAPVFAALGDPYRLSIIERLCEHGPLPTATLNDSGTVSRQGLTKHLRVLEGAGLVGSFRVGRDRQWQVRTEQLASLRAYLDQMTIEWEARLEKLKSLVEGSGSGAEQTSKTAAYEATATKRTENKFE